MLRTANCVISLFMVLALLAFTLALSPEPADASVITGVSPPGSYIAAPDDIVNIPDTGLKEAIYAALGKDLSANITQAELATISSLDAGLKSVQDLEGIQYCTGLTNLILYFNQITDVSQLAGLTGLQTLMLCHNYGLNDISGLSGLTDLRQFWFSNTKVSSIGILSGMSQLNSVSSQNTSVTDFNVFSGLTGLAYLNLSYNNISDIGFLVNNTGLDTGDDTILLEHNQLDITPGSEDMNNIQILLDRGIALTYLPQDYTPPDTNHAPVMNAIGNKNAIAGEALQFTVSASDIDGDTLIYSASGLPPGASFDADTYTFTWASCVEGVYSGVEFKVTDGELEDLETIIITVSAASGEEGIVFGDLDLENVIREYLDKPTGPIYPSEAASIEAIMAANKGITDITGIEYCTGAASIILCYNDITDLSPLGTLEELQVLWITNNPNLGDLTPLTGLKNLTLLKLTNSNISDISALLNCTSLNSGYDLVVLDGNPLDLTEGSDDMNDINTLAGRGVKVYYSFDQYQVTVNPTGQGQVTQTIIYDDCMPLPLIRLQAIPDDGWSFSTWSGSVSGNSTTVDIPYFGVWTVNAIFTQNSSSGGGSTGDTGSGTGIGGGGGGAPASPTKRVTGLIRIISSEGMLLDSVEAFSVDEYLQLLLPIFTQCNNAVNSLLSMIIVEQLTNIPDRMLNNGLIGEVYSLKPEGAKFSPDVKLIIRYDPKKLPESADPSKLNIVWFDEEAEEWVALKSEVDTVKHTVTAYINHFSYYSLMAKSAPAAFEVDSVMLVQEEVQKGETTQVKAVIANTGDMPGDYAVILEVNGIRQEEKVVYITGGNTAEVSFDVAFDKSGIYAISVSGVEKALTVLPSPASFELTKLVISPTTCKVGEDVLVSFTLINSGETDGIYTVSGTIDGAVWENKDISVGAGASEQISFTIKTDAPGIHNIAFNEILLGSFTVAEPLPLATTGAAAVTSPSASETAEITESPTAAGSSLGATILIIAGGLLAVVIASMLIINYVRKRRSD